MPKTTSQNKTNRKTAKAGTGLRAPPATFYWDAQPMPSSDIAWRHCAKICKLGWSAFYRKNHGLLMALSEICDKRHVDA
jgi:hypothetical protein